MTHATPVKPVSVVPDGGWRDAELHVFRHPPGRVDLPGPREHMVILTLGGSTTIDDVGDGRREKKFSETGSFGVCPAERPIVRAWDGDPEVLIAFLKPAFVDGVAADLDVEPSRVRVEPIVAEPDPVMHNFGLLLRPEAMAPDRASTLVADSIVRALTVHLLRNYVTGRVPGAARVPVLHDRRLAPVIEYMRHHVGDPLQLQDLAAQCGLSATHFARAFRLAIGTSPHAFLIDLRVEKARALLARTELPITEVAWTCGFGQSQYFATVFRRKTGVTPSEWRNRTRRHCWSVDGGSARERR